MFIHSWCFCIYGILFKSTGCMDRKKELCTHYLVRQLLLYFENAILKEILIDVEVLETLVHFIDFTAHKNRF